MNQRILILGGGGMLGQAVAEVATSRGLSFAAPDHQELDLCDTEQVERSVADVRPDVVVNCAAFTQVDLCEEQEELATEVNGFAAGRAAAAAADAGARFIHVSTDYVFDGQATQPYEETHPTAPIQAYGRSKLVGESLVGQAGGLSVRTSWLFGPGGPNFADTMLKLAVDRDELQVVDDQLGCPTYTPYLAAALLDLVSESSWARLGDAQTTHYSNPEPVTWFGFARAIFEASGVGVNVVPVTTEAFPRPAARPAYSVLSLDGVTRILGRPVESWREGLADYLNRRSSSVPSGASVGEDRGA